MHIEDTNISDMVSPMHCILREMSPLSHCEELCTINITSVTQTALPGNPEENAHLRVLGR